MADEQAPKKVVKRVVRKPVAPNPPLSPTRPVMRYGRPVAGPVAKVAARDQPAAAPPTSPAAPTVVTVTTPEPRTSPSIPRTKVSVPTVDLGPVIDALRSRTATAASAIRSGASRSGRATSGFAAGRWAVLRAWRIPHLAPARAALLSGLLVGAVSVGLGVGALRLFTEVRGVANGGPLWGSLTFVVVTIIAFALGERLLTGFGAAMARLTSFLGVVLTMITILSVLLGLADSRYGIVIVPIVSAAAFLLSHWLLSLAESSPADVE